MIKTKFRSMTIAALMLVFALVLSFAIGTMAQSMRASAAVEYRPSAVFSAGTGGTVGASEAAGGVSYVEFDLNKGGSVHFRRDLALKWFAASDSSEGTVGGANPAKQHYFTATFAFPAVNFTKFSVVFESAEENISKESTAKNSLVFLNDEGGLRVAVRNASEQNGEDWEPAHTVALESTGDYVLTMDEKDCSIGEFAIYVNGEFVGKLTNIGGNFLEYLSSASTTPRIPMTFTADELKEGASDQKVTMKALNGQTFDLVDGEVVDNAAPVLVLNEEIYAYTLGRKWSLTYEAIDVCDSSVTVTRRYAMLGAPDAEGLYKKPAISFDNDDENSDYKNLNTATAFMPTSDTLENEQQYVSIYFDLDDGRTLSTDEEKAASRVFLTWYAAEQAVKTMGEGNEAFDYILVDRDKYGPYYIGVEAREATKDNYANDEAQAAKAAYQRMVDEVTENLSAGNGAYFYLPSLRGLIASDYADYRNLRFNVYYKKQSHEVGASASSATSLRYNALRFEVNEEGKYIFKVLASDASGNVMQYYVENQLVDVTSSNIWDIEEIPEFTFTATYNGAFIEDPGEQAKGYRDSTYTISSFDIVALSGYETEYKLYHLDPSLLDDGVYLPSSYSDFVENAAKYFEEYNKALVEVRKYNNDVTEDDEDRWNKTDNKYHWNPDNSLSFVPQEKAYYIVRLVVTEARMPGHSTTAYQIIDVSNPTDPIPNYTYWIENNVTSVVLFSISAVLLVVIIVLFVVKPSEKKVEDVDLERLKGGKKKN